MAEKTKKYVFIAHYVEPWNWLLNFAPFAFLHKRSGLPAFLLPISWFVCWPIVSVFFLFRRESFKVVDSFRVDDRVHGYTILINNFGWHFLLKRYHERMRQRILDAALFAQNELHVDVIGLGALTKDETLTQGGLWLQNQPGISVPVVHGDTCTAWFVAKRLEEIYSVHGNGEPIAMIGPTSKIGRAVILRLVQKGYCFKAYTLSRERFLELKSEIPERFQSNLVHATHLQDMHDCRVWVTGKYKPSGKKLALFMPKGVAVLNFAVPDPLSESVLSSRKDICHFDGGLVVMPDTCEMQYMMRLKPTVTYACSGGTMAHAHYGWKNSEVGDVNMDEFESIGKDCERMGLRLAARTSHLK